MSTPTSDGARKPGEDAKGLPTGSLQAWTYEQAWGLPESCLQDNLGIFRSAYLDYLEGCRVEPPSMDCLSGTERRFAEAFIKSTEEAAGFDPCARMPSLEELLARAVQNGYTDAVAALARLEDLLARDESFERYVRGTTIGQREVGESGKG